MSRAPWISGGGPVRDLLRGRELHLPDLAVMEVAFTREREERLERIVLGERCSALPER